MRDTLRISGVNFVAAEPSLVATGLLGWASVTLGEFVVDGLAVRRTRDGGIVVVFPARVDRRGARHPVVRPTTNETRRAIEAQVFAELRRRGVLP